MNRNPMEECPPDDPVDEVTFKFKLENGVWSLHCPEWECTLNHKSMTRLAAILAAEIENHNSECDGKLVPIKDWNKFAEQEGLPRLKKKHLPKQPAKLRRSPAPDDGTCTDRRHSSWWQYAY